MLSHHTKSKSFTLKATKHICCLKKTTEELDPSLEIDRPSSGVNRLQCNMRIPTKMLFPSICNFSLFIVIYCCGVTLSLRVPPESLQLCRNRMSEGGELQNKLIRAQSRLTVQFVVQCSVVHCSAVQCSAVQCSAVQCNAVQCNAVQCSAVSSVQPTLLLTSFTTNHQVSSAPQLVDTSLHCTIIYYSALLSFVNCTEQYCNTLHCTVLYTTTLN